MYLIIGATGNVGGELVTQLVDQGQKVRVLVRDASRAERLPGGIEVAVGDLGDLGSLTAAARGVDGVFYMQVEPRTDQAEKMVQAARTNGVRKIVLLSSMGTVVVPAPTIGAGIAARDQVFRSSGLDVTYLRASGLMSNALWWAASIRDQGTVVDPTDPGHIGIVDPYDVARVAALALTQDGHGGHGYLLTGPESLTSREQTEILADVLDRPIELHVPTPEQFAQESIEHGTPPQLAAALRNLHELFRADRASVLTDDIANLTGVAPRTFREWSEHHTDAFR